MPSAAKMNSYEFQHQQILDGLLTSSQKELGWPWIACMFNDIVPKDNVGFDLTWEGFATIEDAGGTRLVPSKNPGYAVFKPAKSYNRTEGECAIPATPNNIKRLDALQDRMIVRKVEGKEDELLGMKPPIYTRILEASAEDIKAQIAMTGA